MHGSIHRSRPASQFDRNKSHTGFHRFQMLMPLLSQEGLCSDTRRAQQQTDKTEIFNFCGLSGPKSAREFAHMKVFCCILWCLALLVPALLHAQVGKGGGRDPEQEISCAVHCVCRAGLSCTKWHIGAKNHRRPQIHAAFFQSSVRLLLMKFKGIARLAPPRREGGSRSRGAQDWWLKPV